MIGDLFFLYDTGRASLRLHMRFICDLMFHRSSRRLKAIMFDALQTNLGTDLRVAFDEALKGLVATARTQLDAALAELARERAKGLAEVAREKADLLREVAVMHKYKEAQEGAVVLNVGGYRYETSVQTLRRLPHTFFDAYFGGRYAQDVCTDGSIFIDRDGEHFGQVLQYLRDGMVLVEEQDASELDVSVLRWLKREFGFYCIELMADPQEVVFTVGGALGGGALGGGALGGGALGGGALGGGALGGGALGGGALGGGAPGGGTPADKALTATMERFDIASGVWREGSSMATPRATFDLCTLDGVLYAIGGVDTDMNPLASVERYDPSLDSWSTAPPLPNACAAHCGVSVGDTMYVIGGMERIDGRPRGVKSVFKFDGRTQVWSKAAPMPVHRTYAGACVVGSNIYILGGTNAGDIITATTYRYSVDTDAWSTLAPMPEVKTRHRVCTVRGLIYVLGGMSSKSTCSSSVHRFDSVANLWSTVAPMLSPRYTSASFVLDGILHVAGGWKRGRSLSSVERYDAVLDTWTEVSAMTQARYNISAHTTRL
jgi:N-acetylneuraminic acid mutarotase